MNNSFFSNIRTFESFLSVSGIFNSCVYDEISSEDLTFEASLSIPESDLQIQSTLVSLMDENNENSCYVGTYILIKSPKDMWWPQILCHHNVLAKSQDKITQPFAIPEIEWEITPSECTAYFVRNSSYEEAVNEMYIGDFDDKNSKQMELIIGFLGLFTRAVRQRRLDVVLKVLDMEKDFHFKLYEFEKIGRGISQAQVDFAKAKYWNLIPF